MRAVLAALLLGVGTASPAELRLAGNARLSGWMREASAHPEEARVIRAKREALDYFRDLGFTHVLYHLERPFAPVFRKGREWIYNGGDYARGDHAESLAAMKREVESRGMRLVPALECLSHVETHIALDPSISEFDRRNPKPPPPWTWDAAVKAAYLAYDGIAAPGPLGRNPGADQFFREYLRIIRAVWAAGDSAGPGGSAPAHVLIGHDELGYGPVFLATAGKSRWRPEGKVELVAQEIEARIGQVGEIVGSGTGVILFGDSFLPADYGQTYGLAGDLRTGEGGVLRRLQANPGTSGRFLVLPWGYSMVERDGTDPGRKLLVSKARQLDYLQGLGVGFIAGTGEDGGIAPTRGLMDRTAECTFEWVREARSRPGVRRGFAHLSFNNFEDCWSVAGHREPVCAGYGAPWLAYLAWSAEGQATGRSLPEARYSPSVFSGVDAPRSRRDRRWRAGEHYPGAREP